MKIDLQALHHTALLHRFGCVIFLWVALAASSAQAVTILVLGDSLSAGYGIRLENAWPSLLHQRLKSAPKLPGAPHRIVNASISGETTSGGLSRLGALLDRHRPQIVILALGANDGLRGLSLAMMRDNLNAMLQQIRNKGARPLLVGMRLPPNYGPYAVSFEQTFADLARQTGTPYVPFLLDRLQQEPIHFQPDRLHPTLEAQAILLDNVWPTLQTMLR